MSRRSRSAAPGRGKKARAAKRSASPIPWLAIALGAAAVIAVIALTQLGARRPPVASPPKIQPTTAASTAPPASAPRATSPPPAPTPSAPPATVVAAVATAPRPASAPAKGLAGVTAPSRSDLPRVAIVLDDCGQRLDLIERAARIRQPITFAVIPHLPHSRASAEAAFAAGHEVIVHQPMEPESGDEDPGQGAIVSGMGAKEVRRALESSLADVPHAAGFNNHMGSRATADQRLMDAVFHAASDLSRSRPLYFLDSRTTAKTVALDEARKAGLRAAQRNVFLDNDLAPAAILGQLDVLLQDAARDGEAVGIGHLKPETLGVLETALPRAEGTQARFVFLGDLVR